MKLKGEYTGFTLSVHPSFHLSVCLWTEFGVVSTLYFPQHSPNPFNFSTSYQATLKGVSFFGGFFNQNLNFCRIFFYFRLLDPWYDPDHSCLSWWPWPPMLTLTYDSTHDLALGLCIFFRLLCSQIDLVSYWQSYHHFMHKSVFHSPISVCWEPSITHVHSSSGLL